MHEVWEYNDTWGKIIQSCTSFQHVLKISYAHIIYVSLFSVRFGDNCLPSDDGTYNYTKMASEMKTTSLEGASGMEIAGGSFGDVFFSAGAKANCSDSKVCYLCWETNISPKKSHF